MQGVCLVSPSGLTRLAEAGSLPYACLPLVVTGRPMYQAIKPFVDSAPVISAIYGKALGSALRLRLTCCRHFAREIAAYDIQTKRCDVYGQGEGYRERVMLIYDGLHYDALAVAGTHTASFTQGLLSCASQAVIALTQGSMLAEFCQPMFLLCARACQAVFECLKCMAPCCFCTTMLHRSISFTELSG